MFITKLIGKIFGGPKKLTLEEIITEATIEACKKDKWYKEVIRLSSNQRRSNPTDNLYSQYRADSNPTTIVV